MKWDHPHKPYIQLWLRHCASLSLKRVVDRKSVLGEVLLRHLHAVEDASGEDGEARGQSGELQCRRHGLYLVLS